jgi:hypothetical protein
VNRPHVEVRNLIAFLQHVPVTTTEARRVDRLILSPVPDRPSTRCRDGSRSSQWQMVTN